MTSQATLDNVVLSYPKLFVPKPFMRNGKAVGEPRYGATLLLPGDVDWDKINNAIDFAAIKKFGDKVDIDSLVMPYFQPEKEANRLFEGQWAISAKSREEDPPTVVQGDLNPLLDKSQIFAGTIVNVQINFWGYPGGNDSDGVTCDLNLVQVVDFSSDNVVRLDGRMSVSEAFKPISGAPTPTSDLGEGQRPGRRRPGR